MPTIDPSESQVYRFGDFELDVPARRLLRLGRMVAIQPKPFDLLEYLIRHRDRVVSREELLAEVWRGAHVDDVAVRFTIHAVRRAVGDDGSRQAVIRTAPRAGFQFAVPVQQIEARGTAAMAPAASPRSPFLGRDRLLTEFSNLLEAARCGEGRVLLLSGAAGIGKTRALERLAEIADSHGFRVMHGRCVESDGAPAFWPWLQILRTAVSSNPATHLLRSLAAGAPALACLLPELRAYTAELQPAESTDARAARFIMFDSVTRFLKELSAEVPHVLAIDDLHRADPASAALFHHVAREMSTAEPQRLVLAATYRDGELRVTPALAESVASVSALSHSRREPLAGLEAVDVAKLVELLSGRAPSKSVVTDLHEKTSGNPFFLHQIVRVLEREDRIAELESSAALDLELPPHVQDAICRQLRVLPDSVRETVEFAAAIGNDFTVTELEVALEFDRLSVLGHLGIAVEAGVIAERAGEPGRYRFVHALMRDAIYAGLGPEVRAEHHGRFARVLEERIPEHPSAESAALAHHYSHSARREDIARSIHFYEMAAKWSSERGAFEDAPGFLDRALALLDDTGPLARIRRCRLLLQLGDALTDAGQRERAREVLQAAAAVARRAGLREEVALAALRFAPDLLAIETGVYDPDLVRLLEEALSGLGHDSTALRAKLLARLAVAHQWNDEQPARSGSLCEAALDLAAKTHDPEARDYAETSALLVDFSMAHPERQMKDVSHHSVQLEILQRVLRVTSLMLLGQVAEADAEIQRFADLVVRSRHPQARWYVDLMRATRAQMEGRNQEAAVLAEAYLALGAKFGDRNATHSYVVQRIMMSFDVDGVESLESSVRGMVASFPNMCGWRAGLVLFLVELGRLEEARVELQRVVASGALEDARPNEWYGTYGALALVCGVLKDHAIAARMYEALLPHADHLAVVGYCSYCLGSTHRLLAALASGMGRWELAVSHFNAAILKNSTIGADACNARVYFEHARVLQDAGRHAEVWECGARAMEAASRYGMHRLKDKIKALGS